MDNREQDAWLKAQGLYEALAAYGKSSFYPYHMPGHKRNCPIEGFSDIFPMDITEIDGFDNLHQASGILKEAEKRAAMLYGSEEAFFLVNGSTCGILAAISATTDIGDTILIARNCHKSVYHAALLQQLHLQYLYPGQITEYGIADAVGAADVEATLENHPECSVVVITSPTYEGIIAEIGEISRIVHQKNKILIVDEAHGAHLGLSEDVHENAVRQGADIVIHSLHKTLPSMTQTALLHVNGPYVNRMRLRRYLGIYQSSSPSYVLMASMDSCISYMRENASDCLSRMKKYRQRFMEQVDQCKYIHIANPQAVEGEKYHFVAWDICKLVIFTKPVRGWQMSGQELYDLLREDFHLQPEMAAGNYVLAIMTIADGEDGWQRLADALGKIDDKIENTDTRGMTTGACVCRDVRPDSVMSIAEAYHRLDGGLIKKVPFTCATGMVAGSFINLYPPGIPLIVPGEIIDGSVIAQIQEYQKAGLPVQGVLEDGAVIVC